MQVSEACKPFEMANTHEGSMGLERSLGAGFERIKKLISEPPVFKHYNPAEQLQLQCDSLEGDLGTALMQNQQLMAFATQALADIERGHAQIEKELLVVLFGLQQVHQFTLGQNPPPIHHVIPLCSNSGL